MNRNTAELTGSYIGRLTQKVAAIEKDAKWIRARRILLSAFLIIVCGGGILYGAGEKGKEIEARYEQFIDAPDRSNLDQDMMNYRDVYETYVNGFLGNNPGQSLMGGYYYSGDGTRIYPDEGADRTMISAEGTETVLTRYLADNINVRDGRVIYRNPDNRAVYEYSINDKTTRALKIRNSGQFVVCGEVYYYIDLTTGALVERDPATGVDDVLVKNGVESFAMAGKEILYLSGDRTLSVLDLESGRIIEIGKNVIDFSYEGELWVQVSASVYRISGEERTASKVELGMDCNRLLGATSTGLVFESADGVYFHDLNTGVNDRLCDGGFLDVCGDSVLRNNLETYEVVVVNR